MTNKLYMIEVYYKRRIERKIIKVKFSLICFFFLIFHIVKIFFIIDINDIKFFSRYIELHGMKFSKEDHIAFVKLIYELLTIPNLDPNLVNKFSTTLILLLK